MRIALIIGSLSGGGAEKAFLRIGIALRNAGTDARIIAVEKRVDHEIPGSVPVHMIYTKPNSLSHSWLGKLPAAWQLRKAYRQLETDGPFDLAISTLTPCEKICQMAGIPRL